MKMTKHFLTFNLCLNESKFIVSASEKRSSLSLTLNFQDTQVTEASPHIANIGRLVEDMENKIRQVNFKLGHL